MEIIENLDAPLGNSVFSQEQLNSKNLLELFNQQKAYNSSNLFPFQLHLLSYTAGLVAGQSWREEKIKVIEKQPIAYLYNDVQLPPLPEWDREKYPYAAIETNEERTYFVLIITEKPVRLRINTWNMAFIATEPTQYITWDIGVSSGHDGAWGGEYSGSKDSVDNSFGTFGSVLWANFDVLKEDGAFYLSASEPIPVYESDEPEKQPIAYSYNGIQSPDIYTAYTPELQAEYPYAVLFNRPNYDSYITLIISKKPCYVNYSHIIFNIGHSNLKWDEDGAVLEFHDLVFYSDGVTLADSKANLDDVGNVWSNHDILYAEDYNSRYDIDGNPSSTPDPLAGTLFLAASEPVPVYE